MASATDYYLVYRFIKALVTPFKKTKAFKLGIIDDKGKILRKMKDLETSEEKQAYGRFERMVWNLKKIINKIPLLGSAFKSVAAASFLLLKEEREVDLKEKTFLKYFYRDMELLMEGPINSVGSEKIAGLEHDPDGPPIKPRKKRKKKKKKRKKFIDFIRR